MTVTDILAAHPLQAALRLIIAEKRAEDALDDASYDVEVSVGPGSMNRLTRRGEEIEAEAYKKALSDFDGVLSYFFTSINGPAPLGEYSDVLDRALSEFDATDDEDEVKVNILYKIKDAYIAELNAMKEAA